MYIARTIPSCCTVDIFDMRCGLLRFDEKNVHCQCPRCNLFLGCNMDRYAVHLEADYGQGILQEFQRLRNMEEKRWKVDELKNLVEYYQNKIV